MTPLRNNNPLLISSRINLRAALRTTLILVIYIIIFTGLDWLSRGFQIFPGIVAWYPPDGLSFALLLTLGARFLPAIALTSLISGFLVFQLSLSPLEFFGWAVFSSFVLGLAAMFLRRRVRIDLRLRTTRDLFWLIVSAASISTILAVVSVSASAANGEVPQAERLWATTQWWIGEMIGILVLAPVLLIHVMPHVKRFVEGEAPLQKTPISFRRPSLWVIMQALSIIVAIYLAIYVSWPNDFHPFFLIAIPLIWIAIQHGLSGTSLGNVLVNFGITLTVQGHHHFTLAELGQLQLMMLVISVASLLIGIIVSENKRSMHSPIAEIERRRKKIVYELILISVLALAAWILEYTFDFYEAITEWETLSRVKGVAETIVTILFLGIAFAIFSYRRWKEVQAEILEREKAQAELHSLHSELEARIQERTVDLVETNRLLQDEIHDRKQAEESLVKNERRYRALVEKSMEEVALIGADGTLLFESPTTRRPLGYEPDSFLGHNLFELFHPDDMAGAIELLGQIVRQPGSHHEVQFRLRHQDGSWRWMEGIVTNMLDEPAVQAIVINYRDVTERKQAEEEIQSLARFPSENPNPILRLTSDGTILYANKASTPLLDSWGREVGQTVGDEWHEYIKEVFASGLVKEVEIEHAGQTFSCILAPIQRAGYINLYARDITERKQAEEEIRTRTDELRTLYELSRALADADDLDEILNQVNRHAVDSVHTTFARVALLDDDNFVMRAAYPVRVLDHDLLVGKREPVNLLPYCQRVLEGNKSVILRNDSQEINSYERAALLLDFAQSICLIPLHVGRPGLGLKQTLGLLMLGEARSEGREPFTPAKILLSESIGDQAASAIRRMLLHEQTERRLQQLTALREIDQLIASSFDLDLSLRTILTKVAEQLRVDATAIWLFNPASNLLEYSAGRGFHSKAFEQAKPLRLGEGYVGRAALERRMIHISNLTEQADHPLLKMALANEAFVSYFSVPLIAKGNIKGVLEIFHRVPLEPDQDWLDFLNTLAGQAAIAIDNATLFKNLQSSNTDLILAYDTTLEGWSAALDLRDKETEGHTQRVTAMTVRLAKAMGFNQQELVHVRRGALLHDIGKMGVPDRILLKPDKLTDEEWIVMRMHPTYAYQMLKPIAYLGPALDIPYGHHEKWDGTGYPRGLKGEGIPLAARVFAVVDIYDALTSDRPYRKSWTRAKTLKYVRELSGTHLDPRVVEAFLKMVSEDE